MGLHFLTANQEKEILDKRYEYTDSDVADLAFLASAIESIAYVTVGYYLHRSKNDPPEHCIPVLNAIELMAKPIAHFLNEGAPMAEETDAAEGA